MTEMQRQFEKTDQREECLRNQKRHILRMQGWKESCDHPGSLWLWEKTLDDGRVICVTESTAFELERELVFADYEPEEVG